MNQGSIVGKGGFCGEFRHEFGGQAGVITRLFRIGIRRVGIFLVWFRVLRFCGRFICRGFFGV